MPKLWSHAAAQGAVRSNPDIQEALSARYGNGVVLVLPLRSGRFALFGNDRQLVALVEPDEAGQFGEALREIGRQLAERLSPHRQRATNLTMEDLGI